MVSTELTPSCISEDEKAGDRDEASLGSIWDDSFSDWPDVKLSEVMLHRTDAASKSWTCWCLEMRSLEVMAHAGSCSHLTALALERTESTQRIHTDVLSSNCCVCSPFHRYHSAGPRPTFCLPP